MPRFFLVRTYLGRMIPSQAGWHGPKRVFGELWERGAERGSVAVVRRERRGNDVRRSWTRGAVCRTRPKDLRESFCLRGAEHVASAVMYSGLGANCLPHAAKGPAGSTCLRVSATGWLQPSCAGSANSRFLSLYSRLTIRSNMAFRQNRHCLLPHPGAPSLRPNNRPHAENPNDEIR